jgi:two-component system, NtrC family, sensor histidine kinase PilS
MDRIASGPGGPPFLPLAFRLWASFGLLVLHFALPQERVWPGEIYYLSSLAALLLESLWEAARQLQKHGRAFATPTLPWIRWNLFLDLCVVCLLIAFQGIDQERFSTLYIFPVLASAFYLATTEIVGVAVLSAVAHLVLVLGFSLGFFPTFGHSGVEVEWTTRQLTYLLGLAPLQIFAATAVVVPIRRNLESLRTNLSASEAAVDELSALHLRVVESLFSGLITLDREHHITSANPAAESILQVPIQIGSPITELENAGQPLAAALLRNERFELRIASAQGPRILGGQVAPLRDAEGQETGRLLLFQDLTEFKAMEERTRTSERLAAIGQLSAGLAHELRNPLASIMGCVQLISKGDQPVMMQERLLGILARESERVSGIVSSFLDFARPQAIEQERLSLVHLVEEIRASWETDPRAKDLPLQVGFVPDAWIETDPLSFHRMTMNLLSNARKALRHADPPRLSLNFDQAGGRVRMRVEDNGCGMDAEQLRTLFLPFSSGFEEGTGLGMSLVYQFIQQMGWEIRVKSQPGAGTRIEIEIPRSSSFDPAGASPRNA